jgi:NADPH2:quinone reductase
MKALLVRQFGALDGLVIEERPTPQPGEGEVLIDVHAAGVNFPDLLVIQGKYQFLPALPFSPGKECAGVIRAVGTGVTQLKPGDRVLAQVEFGAYAQQVATKAVNCHLIPQAMSYPEAAAMGLTYMTAHFALVERARIQPGETVLVTGAAGGVGLATVQVAKALGATVLAAVSTPDKAAAAKANGADHIIDTGVPDLRDSLRQQVYAAVGKRGVDVIVDSVGGDVFDAVMRAIAWAGRIVVVGFADGRIPEIKAGHVLVKNISIIGLQFSDYRDREPEKCLVARRQLFDLYTAGKLKPHVMATFPFERYLDALALVRDRKVIGKVVLTTGVDG